MNFIETIYCSQYYELKKTGRDPMKGRVGGTLLNATILLLAFFALFVLVNRFVPGHLIHSSGSHWFTGRFIGKMVGLLGILFIGGFLNFTVGSKERYEAMSKEWEKLPVEELEQTVKKAMKTFFIVFGAFLLVMAICFM